MTGDNTRTVRAVEQQRDRLRGRLGLAVSVTVTQPAVTADHTARVDIGLENVTDSPLSLSYTRNVCDLDLLVGTRSDDGPGDLLLIATTHDWERTGEDCWMPDGRNLNCGIPAREYEFSIGARESTTWRYRLWAHPENEPLGVCMPPDTYEFTRELQSESATADLRVVLDVDSS